MKDINKEFYSQGGRTNFAQAEVVHNVYTEVAVSDKIVWFLRLHSIILAISYHGDVSILSKQFSVYLLVDFFLECHRQCFYTGFRCTFASFQKKKKKQI